MENLSTSQPIDQNAVNSATNLVLPTPGQQLTYPLDYVTQEILKDFILTVAGRLPIGSIYTNKSNSANPSTYLKYGTWASIDGYVIAGYKAGDANFGTAGTYIGEAAHTLTVNEIPSHTHVANNSNVTAPGSWGGGAGNSAGQVSGSAGGDAPHNNIQPTLVAYVWERTA